VSGVEGSVTSLKQEADGFTMKFGDMEVDIKSVSDDLQNKYSERASYIQFEDGNIVLGRRDSEIILVIRNDRISFVRNVTNLPELAWFANDVLHVTDGEFMTELTIGKFAFKPGANGNLSFKKVVT
jgi:hypothetical protein